MGRSAKLHKRSQKKATSSSAAPSAALVPTKKATTPVEQRKKAGLKAKVKTTAGGAGKREGPVLGGADYVDMMFGGRKRAAEEGMKIPRDED